MVPPGDLLHRRGVERRPARGASPRARRPTTSSGRDAGDHPDLAIARLASRQYGVVARRQLLELGIGRRAIERRLENGRLHLIHRGVYAVGYPLVSQHGRWLAAVLAIGPGAALSHRSAAAHWRIAPIPDAPIETIVPGGSRRRRPGIVVHRCALLEGRHLTVRERIPLTTVARTLLDLATRITPRALREAFDGAERRRLLDREELHRICDGATGRPGTGAIRALLRERPLPLAEARSKLERRFLRYCRDRELPIPAVNVPVAGYTVDCLWPEQRPVVELDSWAFHGDRDSFEADRRRDARIQRTGCRVIRVTDRAMTREPDDLEREIRALLGLAGRR
jgi:very-short-patch-repair endonuclease